MEKVLFIDDDVNILQAFKRSFRKKYNFMTAEDPEQAIYVIKEHGPFTVIVSDMKMPKLDGASFLGRLKTVCPNTVRIMLTGNSDLQTAVDAVNKGEVFRFHNKPCSFEELGVSIDAAIEQYYLHKGELDILENTVAGCLQLLADIVDASRSRLVDDEMLGMGVRHICNKLHVAFDWQMDVACSLMQIGAITLPSKLFDKNLDIKDLMPEDIDLIFSVPSISAGLIEHIPRLMPISNLLNHAHNGQDDIRSSILTIVYAALVPLGHMNQDDRWGYAVGHYGDFDVSVVHAFEDWEQKHNGIQIKFKEFSAMIKDLQPGYILCGHVELEDGRILAASGTKLTPMLLKRIVNFSRLHTLKEPIMVKVEVGNE